MYYQAALTFFSNTIFAFQSIFHILKFDKRFVFVTLPSSLLCFVFFFFEKFKSDIQNTTFKVWNINT